MIENLFGIEQRNETNEMILLGRTKIRLTSVHSS